MDFQCMMNYNMLRVSWVNSFFIQVQLMIIVKLLNNNFVGWFMLDVDIVGLLLGDIQLIDNMFFFYCGNVQRLQQKEERLVLVFGFIGFSFWLIDFVVFGFVLMLYIML